MNTSEQGFSFRSSTLHRVIKVLQIQYDEHEVHLKRFAFLSEY